MSPPLADCLIFTAPPNSTSDALETRDAGMVAIDSSVSCGVDKRTKQQVTFLLHCLPLFSCSCSHFTCFPRRPGEKSVDAPLLVTLTMACMAHHDLETQLIHLCRTHVQIFLHFDADIVIGIS